MTKTEIRRYWKARLDNHNGDRLVDIEFREMCGVPYVFLIEVSKAHCVWRSTYLVERYDDGSPRLKYVTTQLLCPLHG